MISFDTLAEQLNNPEVLKQLGSQVGASSDQVQLVTKMGLPTIMEALNRNTNDPQGAASLLNALDGHKAPDLSNLTDFLGQVDTEDGAKVLGHILGGRTESIENRMGAKAGLGQDQVAGLLMKLAPMVLSYLGNKKESEGFDASGLSDLTSSLSGVFGNSGGGGAGTLLGLAANFLDSDDDDDDQGGLLGGLMNQLF